MDPYKILGVKPENTPKEIESAYRKASLKCHPDRNNDDPKVREMVRTS